MTRMLATMDKLEMRMLESTEKLDALIQVVDGLVVRRKAPNKHLVRDVDAATIPDELEKHEREVNQPVLLAI